MVYLEKGQKLLTNAGLVVCDPTGYYEDGDPVLCSAAYDPEEPLCRYEAKYIAYGESVYSIGDQEKLMEEVKKIDPESLFGKTNTDIATDAMVNKIKKPKPEVLGDEDENLEEEEDVEEEPEPIPEPEPVPEPEVIPEPEVVPEPEIIPEPIPDEITPEPEPEPEPVPEPEVIPEPEPTPVGEEIGLITKKKRRRIA